MSDTQEGLLPDRAPFTTRLKSALVGNPDARFVYLNNFEVERAWAEGEPRLPGANLSFAAATVNRIEEVGVLLADDSDFVVLKAPVDADYSAYLDTLGVASGCRLVVDRNEPDRSVTADALDSPRLRAELAALNDGATYLMPLGVSRDEELLAEAVGLPLAGPSAEVCQRVNGKIFSRELVDAAGLTPVPGYACRTLGELSAALEVCLSGGGAGDGRVVVKESLGVSGRGMIVLEDARRGSRLVEMLARKGADRPVSVVVERWIEKKFDLNYQFVLGRDGTVHFETVKTVLTRNGAHRGHLFPPPLRPDQLRALESAAEVIGKVLAGEGYFGLVGVDAILGADDTLYPCLEINARFNMATYQNRIVERLIRPEQTTLATVLDLKVSRAHRFDEVRAVLDDLMFSAESPHGVLINNFSTLNAAVVPGRTTHGRVYALCIGESIEEVERMRSEAETALVRMTEAK